MKKIIKYFKENNKIMTIKNWQIMLQKIILIDYFIIQLKKLKETILAQILNKIINRINNKLIIILPK